MSPICLIRLFLAASLAAAVLPSHAVLPGLGGRVSVDVLPGAGGRLGIERGPARDVPPAYAAVSRDDAVSLAQRHSGGRVLSVDRAEAGGRAVWRVKVVTPRGDVRIILIDAVSGQVM